MTDTTTMKRKRGRPPVEARFDNWYGVQDPKERKRIQDRLAQRARRKRIGPVAAAPDTTSSEGTDSPEDHPAEEISSTTTTTTKWWQKDARELVHFSDQSLLIIAGSKSSAKVIRWTESRPPKVSMITAMTLDHWYLRWPAWSIYAALTEHGLMMKTACVDCVFDAISPAYDESLPEDLKPTPLQLVVPHRRWIDRFPFPRLRDNMILLTALINLDDFCSDIFNTDSFTLRPSTPSWEPRSWIIGNEFASKWGYLFR